MNTKKKDIDIEEIDNNIDEDIKLEAMPELDGDVYDGILEKLSKNDENDDFYKFEQEEILPIIPLKSACVLPFSISTFDVGRIESIRSLEDAVENESYIFLSAQKSVFIDFPEESDIHRYGTVCKINNVVNNQNETLRVTVEGLYKARMDRYIEPSEDSPAKACITILNVDEKEIDKEDKIVYEAIYRKILNEYTEYSNSIIEVPNEITEKLVDLDGYYNTLNLIASSLFLKFEERQDLLDINNLYNFMELVEYFLNREVEVVKIDKKINISVRKQLNKVQKEYYLREQLKAIQQELGDYPQDENEVDEWLQKLVKLNASDKTKEKIKKEIDRLQKTPMGSPDYNVSRNYLDTIFSLPWNKESRNRFDIKKSEKILNEDHYGLKDVKERILEYLAVKKVSKSLNSPVICLAGPPGVGKTSIANSVARSLGRQFVRISLGGVRDEAEIRGHRRTYVGAIPGRIINAIKEAKTKNPVILLDEIDKMSSDFKGDPTAAMLEVLDPEQNKYFTDHYLELPFDLSKVLFITTANDLRQIPRPLYDRMEVIEIEGYLEEEKVEIVKDYILRKQLSQNGLKKNFIKIDDDVIKYIISCYTREAGVRQLERTIGKICRKIVKEMVENPKLKPVDLSKEDVVKYLGTEKYRQEPLDLNPQVGLVNGLAWTAVGGVTLEVEVNVLPGKGQIVLTGMMGDVMKESARTGISYIRSIASKLGIDENFYKEKDIHIHIPEGATPKDGPSAGITMTLATISALTGRLVPGNIAMTGEITLRGRVLAVGGIREKVLAAYRMGIRKIIIPKDCKSDLDKIPENIKSDIEFILVDKMDQVIDVALMNEKGEDDGK